jgi:hypothetical protein
MKEIVEYICAVGGLAGLAFIVGSLDSLVNEARNKNKYLKEISGYLKDINNNLKGLERKI